MFELINAGDPAVPSGLMTNYRHLNYGTHLRPVNNEGADLDGVLDLGSATHRYKTLYCKTPPTLNHRVQVSMNADVSIAMNQDYTIAWDTVVFDPKGMAGSDRVTIMEAGTYIVHSQTKWGYIPGNSSDLIRNFVEINGSNYTHIAKRDYEETNHLELVFFKEFSVGDVIKSIANMAYASVTTLKAGSNLTVVRML